MRIIKMNRNFIGQIVVCFVQLINDDSEYPESSPGGNRHGVNAIHAPIGGIIRVQNPRDTIEVIFVFHFGSKVGLLIPVCPH